MIRYTSSLMTALHIVELLKNDVRAQKCCDLYIDSFINEKNSIEQGFCISKSIRKRESINALKERVWWEIPLELLIHEDKLSNSIIIEIKTQGDISRHDFDRDFDKAVDFIFKNLIKYYPKAEKK